MTLLLWFVLGLIVAAAVANSYCCRKRIAYAAQQIKEARIVFLKVLRREVYGVNFSLDDFIPSPEYHEIRFYQDPDERRAFEKNQGTLEDLYIALNRMQRIWGISDKDLGV